ncbi:MAG: helix-turn-helix transcriptional regulator [Clostridia bacterium]|nr:helix-turn-helix transcriptional regulator [Clostridia bacterium]
MEHLGEQIYHYRTKKGLSQQELAEKLDVSRQSVSKWEVGGAVPDLERLVKMASLFGVTLDALVTGEENETVSLSIPKETTGDETMAGVPFVPKKASGLRMTPWQMALIFLGLGLLIAGAHLFFEMIFRQLSFAQMGQFLLVTYLLDSLPFMVCGALCFCRLKRQPLIFAWVLVFFVYFRLNIHFAVDWYGVINTGSYILMGDTRRLLLSWLILLLFAGLMVFTVRYCRDFTRPTEERLFFSFIYMVLSPVIGWIVRRPTQLLTNSLAGRNPPAVLFWLLNVIDLALDLFVLILFAYCFVRVYATIVAKRKGEA